MNERATEHSNTRLSWMWFASVKYIHPIVLLGLLTHAAKTDDENKGVDKLPAWLQVRQVCESESDAAFAFGVQFSDTHACDVPA